MKDRLIVCKHYICEHKCTKERDATFYKYCQKCDKYFPKEGGSVQKNLYKEKKEKYLKDMRNFF